MRRMEEKEVSSSNPRNKKWMWNAKRAALGYVKEQLYEQDALMLLGKEGFKRAARNATHSMVGRWKIRCHGGGNRSSKAAESMMSSWANETVALAIEREIHTRKEERS